MSEVEDTQVTSVLDPKGTTISRLLTSDVVDSSGFLVRPQCKVCQSPLRREADEMYEANGNASKVKEWLETKGLVVCVQSVRHHMREHYKSMERMLALSEYCDQLQTMVDRRRSRRDQLDMVISMAEMEIARVVSISTNGSLSKEKDRSSIIVNSMKAMVNAIQALNSMEDADSKTKAVQHRFIQVWRDMIEGADSEEKRRTYVQALDSFKKALEDTE
jgi:hypothetical protein